MEICDQSIIGRAVLSFVRFPSFDSRRWSDIGPRWQDPTRCAVGMFPTAGGTRHGPTDAATLHPMNHRLPALFTGVACLLMNSALAHAHDTWLAPKVPRVQPGDAVTFDLTSGMAFPELDHAVGADRIARAAVRLSGRTEEVGERTSAA